MQSQMSRGDSREVHPEDNQEDLLTEHQATTILEDQDHQLKRLPQEERLLERQLLEHHQLPTTNQLPTATQQVELLLQHHLEPQ